MRALLYTPGSPFARAVRIVLDELELDYERREVFAAPDADQMAASTPTLQVPTFWDGDQKLWESGLIVEYLLSTYKHRPNRKAPLAQHAFRPDAEWHDKLTFATIQTFGNAVTTISQMKWSGVAIEECVHLERSAARLSHVLRWLDGRVGGQGSGFMPGCVSMQDIFLAAHVRFAQARPLGIELDLKKYPRVDGLLELLDRRESFRANPVWWWEPGIVGYESDGTPILPR